MKLPLGRNGLIGLAVGASAGLGLIAFIIYREIRRRRFQKVEENRSTAPRMLLIDSPEEEEALPGDTLDAAELEAQAAALAAVEAVVHGLSPQQQLELRNQLDQVLHCVSSLRSEVADLRDSLQDIASQIVQDVKKGVEDSQRVRRRRHVIHRERTDSTSSSSIYFTASQGLASPYEETSEGGYSTAYAESDYTDRDTDREEGEREQEPEQESDEDEDKSCATVITLKLEEAEERGLIEEEEVEDEEEERKQQLVNDVPSGELSLLLAQSDILHTGDSSLKAEGYQLLLDNKEEYGHSREFLWRLARAYRDMYQSAQNQQQKILYAQLGREEAEEALKKNGLNAECHKWFAMVTGLTTQHESLHGKLKSSFVTKEHLDRAMTLRDDDPVCYYLLGRWSYMVSSLDWLEKRAAAALYRTPPNASLQDALNYFLKAEELSPGFSRNVRLYIAKCYMELQKHQEASHWTQLALETPADTDQDEDSVELEAQLRPTDRKL